MNRDRGLRHFIVSIVGALASFLLVGIAIYYMVADVRVNGFLHGGPASLAAAMAGLFGGGIVALLVLVVLLRRGSHRDGRQLES